ncbi:MAG TPA: acyl-CoA dehydrogenase family protein [Solirubrobacteraceae bacterium]|nr:acyl-CoA dehydrogenase family protein [Solirubrobacteraceae bacterium]
MTTVSGDQRVTGLADVADPGGPLTRSVGSSSPAERRPAPPFTPEHEDFRAAVRRFVATELAPKADEWEAARWFPDSVFTRLAELGYIGLKFDPSVGGDGDPVADAVFVEELAWCGSGGLAAGIGAHTGIALPPIAKFGTPEQQARYLVPGIRGERIAALAITEPGAGSDVAAISTTARPVEGGWLVSGSKQFITGGCRARTLVTAVKTTAEGGHHGISFLIIDAGPDVPGLSTAPIEKLGWHASDTALIAFDEVFVPRANLLGEENGGFALIMANFQWERLLMSLGALGAMRWCFDRTLRYARERVAFGRPISAFQVTRHTFAEMAVTIQAAEALTYEVLRRYVAGGDVVALVTQAKLFTQRAAVDVADTCLQIHGGAGYMVEYGIERCLRDARLGPIGGGTDEIMKEILGRTLGL